MELIYVKTIFLGAVVLGVLVLRFASLIADAFHAVDEPGLDQRSPAERVLAVQFAGLVAVIVGVSGFAVLLVDNL